MDNFTHPCVPFNNKVQMKLWGSEIESNQALGMGNWTVLAKYCQCIAEDMLRMLKIKLR